VAYLQQDAEKPFPSLETAWHYFSYLLILAEPIPWNVLGAFFPAWSRPDADSLKGPKDEY
jgi:hypothetical protein